MEGIQLLILGVALPLWTLSQLLQSSVLLWQVLDIGLIALGLGFLVTRIRGYCLPYKVLGWSMARPLSQSPGEMQNGATTLGRPSRLEALVLDDALLSADDYPCTRARIGMENDLGESKGSGESK